MLQQVDMIFHINFVSGQILEVSGQNMGILTLLFPTMVRYKISLYVLYGVHQHLFVL